MVEAPALVDTTQAVGQSLRQLARDVQHPALPIDRREQIASKALLQVLHQLTGIRRNLAKVEEAADRNELTTEEYWVAYAAAVGPDLMQLEEYLTSMAGHLTQPVGG